jgi:hypothetical protein
MSAVLFLRALSEVCAATGRSCQAKPLQGVRSQSDVQQTLTTVDVSLASAFEPSASSTEVFTGLHAHYTATSWDATAGMWHDVSGNAQHGVEKYKARSAEYSVRVCPSSVCVCVMCACVRVVAQLTLQEAYPSISSEV